LTATEGRRFWSLILHNGTIINYVEDERH
jgi:hypothetical protein